MAPARLTIGGFAEEKSVNGVIKKDEDARELQLPLRRKCHSI
jgi:hypothetical protein